MNFDCQYFPARTPVVALLAGGLGTRLGAATADLPKSLVPVAGRPFIDHQLAWLHEKHCDDIVICAGHLGEMIEEHVGDGAARHMRIQYSYDGGTPLGTAGALRKALPLLGDTFLALYGDSYLDAISYVEVWLALHRGEELGVMSVYRNHDRWDRSNCLVADGRVLRYDKRQPTPDMEFIDYGLVGLHAAALSESAHSDMGEVYRQLAAAGQLKASDAAGRFYEIGTPEGLEATAIHLRAKKREEYRLAALQMRMPRRWSDIIEWRGRQ